MKIPISLYIKAFQKIHVRDERLFTDFFFRFTCLVKKKNPEMLGGIGIYS